MKKQILFCTVLLLIVFVSTMLIGCAEPWQPMDENQKTIVIAASPTPHAEILEQAKAILAEQGYTLEIKVYTDYVQPNIATEVGDVDANFFQHVPYLDQFNADNDTHLVSVGAVHYESFAIYQGKKTSLDELTSGDIILIPNDGTNRARALFLLQEAGLIVLSEDAGMDAGKQDIVSNPRNIVITEMEARNIPVSRMDAAMAVINGNYALDSNLGADLAVCYESSTGIAAQTYGNVLVVRDGNQNHPAILALLEVLKSQEIVDFINQNYNGVVRPL